MRKFFVPLLFLGILAGTGLLYLTKSLWMPNQGISGYIDLNGVAPQQSTITISQKPAGSKEPSHVFIENVPAKDGISWRFTNAKKNHSYEIQATVMVSGTVITSSSPIFTTAPAKDELLVLNVESEQLAAAAIITPTPAQAIISGNVGVNGYIPSGSTINVEGRSLGKATYTVVASGLAAVDNQIMTYSTAVAGRTYEVRGFLYDANGNQIGQSNTITITAPAMNEVLSINSNAKAPITPTPEVESATSSPAVNSVISGKINFNGQTPPNSRIVIFQKQSGTSQYQVAVDNISPTDGSSWQWDSAAPSTSYDLLAILKQKQNNGTDHDISNSNVITVSAPASNEIFNINSGFTLPSVSGNISVSCNNYDGGSQTWQASVSFQSISSAGSYWFQIGTTNGGIELTNFTQNATNNPVQSYNYTFKNNVTYYARYAYSNNQNLLANSPQFSPFSSTQQLRCSQ